jgi:hypothetical protein
MELGTIGYTEDRPEDHHWFLANQSPGLLSRRVSEALARLDCLSRTRRLSRSRQTGTLDAHFHHCLRARCCKRRAEPSEAMTRAPFRRINQGFSEYDGMARSVAKSQLCPNLGRFDQRVAPTWVAGGSIRARFPATIGVSRFFAGACNESRDSHSVV